MLFKEKRMICSLSTKRNGNWSSIGFSNGKSFMSSARTIFIQWWRPKYDWSELKRE